MTFAFQYPAARHVWRHGPRGYADYASFRPWLRDEHCFRCVYCLRREQWVRSQVAYVLDHFFPAARRSAGADEYEDLRYSCSYCNALKSDKLIPDPLQVLVHPLVWVTHDGVIRTESVDALRLIEELALNSDDIVEYRATWIEVIATAKMHQPQLHQRLIGFPNHLPNLSRLRPSDGNSRPDGLSRSCFEMRMRGELPETY